MKLPGEFLRRMEALLKEEYPQYLAAMTEAPVHSLRINTEKISPEEFQNVFGYPLTPVPWCDSGYYYPEDVRPGTLPLYYAGLCYLQEASAMIPAALLPVSDHMTVLDACCAPGGKSTALMCRMHNTGLLVSNDISASRQKATLKTMGRFGAANTAVTAADLSVLSERYPEVFDRILLDAPCSGEGMFRRDPSLIAEWLEKGSDFYAPIQKDLIVKAWRMLKPGGMMVYSTCTFAPEEDEEVVLHLLETCPDAKLMPVENRYDCFAPGVLEGMEDCVRMYPHRLQGEGHFAALLKKDGNSDSVLSVPDHHVKIPEDAASFMKLIRDDIRRERITVHNDMLYLVPEYEINTEKIRVLNSGLLLGMMKNGRFEPSQQLALHLKDNAFADTVHLAPDGEDIRRFLRGETIRTEETHKGWVLVCCGRWPVGFGKSDGHTIKNKMDKGWRML